MSERARRRVVLMGDRSRADVVHAMRQAETLARDHADVITICRGDGFELENPDYDLLINFGGDGSLLGIARGMGAHQRPVVGVNFGKVGFLASFELAGLLVALKDLLTIPVLPRRFLHMIEAKIIRKDGSEEEALALNDAVISRAEVSRLVTLECRIDGDYVTHYKADGLIIATPAGSTAHSLSAGGPLIEPELNALVLTPICAHTLGMRPLVVAGDRTIELCVEESHSQIGATFDGQVFTPLAVGDCLRVRLFPHQFEVVGVDSEYFYAALRSKLGWGGVIKRQNASQRRKAIDED